eukprot:6747040-Prymnesium_polylepis.1
MAVAWCSCEHTRGPCWQGGERRRGGSARLVWGRQVAAHPRWQARSECEADIGRGVAVDNGTG